MSSDISHRMRELRTRSGHTQESLAAASGLSLGVIKKIENGGSSRLKTYQDIARALGARAVLTVEPITAPPSHDESAGCSIDSVLSRGGLTREGDAAATSEVVAAAMAMPVTQVLFAENRCPLDDSGVRSLAQATGAGLEKQYSVKGGGPLCNVAIALHERLLVWLQGDYERCTSDALETFSGELCIWIGWLAIDAGRNDLAHVYLNEAVLHARMARCNYRSGKCSGGASEAGLSPTFGESNRSFG